MIDLSLADAGPVLRKIRVDPGSGADDAIGAMVAGSLGGVIVRDAFSAATVARVLERLGDGQGPLERAPWPEHFRTYSLGGTLDLTGTDLPAHFAQARRVRDGLAEVFAGEPAFEARVQEILGGLSGGRPVEPARGPDDRDLYVPATVKVIASKGYIPPHCEIEQIHRKAYDHLRHAIDVTTLLSWFVMLAPAERGGAVRVSALTWDALDRSKMRDQRTYEAILPVIDRHAFEDLSPSPGDLVIFDGGRHVHQVTPVEGRRTRISVGGFAALNRDRDRVLYWG